MVVKRIQYEEAVIEKAATALYERAADIVAAAAISGLLLGVLFGAVGGYFIAKINGLDTQTGILFTGGACAVLFAYVAAGNAQQRAALLRLQAHTALCQVQIERNTRGAA